MMRLLFIPLVLAVFVLIALGVSKIPQLFRNSENKRPEFVAIKAADAYLNNDVESIRETLKENTQSWSKRDWRIFHKKREEHIDLMKSQSKMINSEMNYLEELKRKDNIVDTALNEIRSGKRKEDIEWERLFKQFD